MLTLTQENYFSLEASREYMSVHQLRSWQECAAREAAIEAGEWHVETSEAFLVGSYVDAAMTEPEPVFLAFCDAHASDIFKGKKGEKRTAFERADQMIAKLKDDPMAMELLTGETQRIITGEIGGCVWKGKLDVLKADKGIFVDLKTAASFEWVWSTYWDAQTQMTRNEKVPWFDGYWFQMGVYQQLLWQNGFRVLEKDGPKPFLPIIVGVSKQDPPDICGLTFEESDRLGLEVAAGVSNLGQILAYKRGDAERPACGMCDFCRTHKKLTLQPAKDYRSRQSAGKGI
jgi:hypothetical protein